MPTFTSPFTGDVVQPTDVSYYALSFSSDTQLYWPTVVNPTQVPTARIMDCAASVVGLSIFLPDATQGAVGEDILFRNLGSNAFTIVDAAGGASFTVPVGLSKYVYLTDNSSVGGTWANVTFAAGTSYADAVTLQGAGLTTIDGKLATTQNIVDVTSTPVINNASRASTFVWGAGAGTFNLPLVSSLSTGWYIGFRNGGTGALTINVTSPSLINGSSSIVANPGDSGFIFYDSTTGNYVTVGLTAASTVTFTAATYDVDAISGNDLSLVAFAPIIQTYIAQSDTRTETLNVTLPAITQIYVFSNSTGHTDYNISFVIDGSSQVPIEVSNGEAVVVLSDSNNLYILTQATTGLFYAANGSAAAPSYSFTNDTFTGMYLVGTNVLGFSANSTNIMTIDNSNILQPLTTIAGELTATLTDVSGGTF